MYKHIFVPAIGLLWEFNILGARIHSLLTSGLGLG